MADYQGPEFDLNEHVDIVHYEVESKHQFLGMRCLCGFTSFLHRDCTKHIVTETLIVAGLEDRIESDS